MHYEYKVIPSPAKGVKGGDQKGAEGRFAHAVEQAINDLAASGWEYQRTDLLPSEERQGLTSSKTVYRSLMIFRRARHGGGTGVAGDPVAATAVGGADSGISLAPATPAPRSPAPVPPSPAGESPKPALRASRSDDILGPGVGFMDSAPGEMPGTPPRTPSRGPAGFLRGNTRT